MFVCDVVKQEVDLVRDGLDLPENLWEREAQRAKDSMVEEFSQWLIARGVPGVACRKRRPR